MTHPVTTTYVDYLHAGSFFPEHESREVAARDPGTAAREAPASAFAFQFHDVIRTTTLDHGHAVPLASRALNKSGLYYIDAEKLTAEDVERLPGDHSILLANMRGNGWATMLRCRTGNFRPLEDGDSVISSAGGQS